MENNPELSHPVEDPSGDSATEGHPEGKPYSHNTYTTYRCRCSDCRKAHSDYQNAWAADKDVAGYRRTLYASKTTPDVHPEGLTPSVYVYNYHRCRCALCKAENAAAARERRRRKREAGEA